MVVFGVAFGARGLYIVDPRIIFRNISWKCTLLRIRCSLEDQVCLLTHSCPLSIVLKPEYFASNEILHHRVNTNTAPIYTNGYDSQNRIRGASSDHPYTAGQSSSHRVGRPNRNKQPGHNHNEQVRRTKEMSMFVKVSECFNDPHLSQILSLYMDRRSNNNQCQARITKKIYLAGLHSIIRNPVRRILKLYQAHLDHLIKVMTERGSEEVCRRLLFKHKDLSCPKPEKCEVCHRRGSQGSGPIYSARNYPINDYNSYCNPNYEHVGPSMSGSVSSRRFALPPENGPRPIGVYNSPLHQDPFDDVSFVDDPYFCPSTPYVESNVDISLEKIPPDDVASSSSSCCNSMY